IVALTANAIQGAEEMFLANGLNGFLSKPIEMPNLRKTLLEWLPPDKIIKKARKKKDDEPVKADDETDDKFWETIDKIEELDAEIGLRRFNGLKGMYRDNLKLFHDKLPHDSENLSKLMDEENYTNFSVAVHAIKSTLASIGAAEMSDTAFRLEMASKNRETDYCVTHFPNFLNQLRFLYERLLLVFPPDDKPAAEKKQGDTAQLRENLGKAGNAIEAFDNDTAIKELNGLLAYDFGEKANAMIADMLAALKRYDFDGAKDILAKI
ncbi:MAG: Hpt domain-containing protein, partial [Candidatus Adiutrix sp.]|nr:Hpt domain-containing protein [Candidatus Adiutrix sp.]